MKSHSAEEQLCSDASQCKEVSVCHYYMEFEKKILDRYGKNSNLKKKKKKKKKKEKKSAKHPVNRVSYFDSYLWRLQFHRFYKYGLFLKGLTIDGNELIHERVKQQFLAWAWLAKPKANVVIPKYQPLPKYLRKKNE